MKIWLLLTMLAQAGNASDAELHKNAIVVDTHSDSTQRILEGRDYAKPQPDMNEDLPKMKAGGLDAQFFSIWIDPEKIKPAEWYKNSIAQFDAVHAMIDKNPRTIAWAKTAADVRKNAAAGVLSALFGVEGGHSLLPGSEGEQLAHLRTFFERGARYMTLTWNNSNPIGGASRDDGQIQGLTPFGRRVLDEMQRIGMMVDLSHVSDPLFWDAIRYVKKPVILSHSSSRQLANVPRNVTDAMLKAVAKNGGAVCVNYFPGFLDADYLAAIAPLMNSLDGLSFIEKERRIAAMGDKLPKVPLKKLIDHIDHMVKVAGVDHVCLGSDFDGVTTLPAGLEDASKMPVITAELKKRGYSDQDVVKILGENTLRVLAANEVHK
jgi:membrane dipeptidase